MIVRLDKSEIVQAVHQWLCRRGLSPRGEPEFLDTENDNATLEDLEVEWSVGAPERGPQDGPFR